MTDWVPFVSPTLCGLPDPPEEMIAQTLYPLTVSVSMSMPPNSVSAR